MKVKCLTYYSDSCLDIVNLKDILIARQDEKMSLFKITHFPDISFYFRFFQHDIVKCIGASRLS